MLLSLVLLVLIPVAISGSTTVDLLNRTPETPDTIQTETIEDLVKRLLPDHHEWFRLVVNGSFRADDGMLDRFRLENLPAKQQQPRILITGTTGVAVANGLYYYLKYVTNSSISWSGDQISLTRGKPVPGLPRSPVDITIRDKYRYYQNTCTASYSNVWWQWPRWQREIDWMALHGINLPLAFNGQEMVYRRTFRRLFNLTTVDIDDYFTGPAFLAWNRMGNIQSWSGPLSEHWHRNQYQLQRQILTRMRQFGMYPVVPGFAGHVPRRLMAALPNATINRLTDWNQFGENYSHTYFLEPEDPQFIQIGRVFVEEYAKLYGTDHFYNVDLFNEETPTSGDPGYLKRCGQNVYQSLAISDPKAVWVMQGWLFLFESGFWGQKQVKAMVTSVPSGRLLILDLFSETVPVYPLFDGYYGQPFIWCMLHNFGGVHGMYGALNKVNEKVFDARRTYPNMLGIGLTMEGIEQNDICYDYMTEVPWYDESPDQIEWFQRYAARRYGDRFDARHLLDQAWQLFRVSVYHDRTDAYRNHGQYVMIRVPGRKPESSPLWYDPRNVTAALRLFAKFLATHPESLKSSETFVYDLVDVSRQTIQLIFDHYHRDYRTALTGGNLAALRQAAANMTEMLELAETVTGASKHWLLSSWIDAARAVANSDDHREQDRNERQARNQITSWGPRDNIVDYAAKQWSGMFRYYYGPRWAYYFLYMERMLAKNETFNFERFHEELFRHIELPFIEANGQDLIRQPDTSGLRNVVEHILEHCQQTLDSNESKPPEIEPENQFDNHQFGKYYYYHYNYY